MIMIIIIYKAISLNFQAFCVKRVGIRLKGAFFLVFFCSFLIFEVETRLYFDKVLKKTQGHGLLYIVHDSKWDPERPVSLVANAARRACWRQHIGNALV